MLSTKLNFCRLVIFSLAVGLMTSGLNSTVYAAPEYAAVKPKLIQPRDGLGNVLAKLKDGQSVKIAYLGGSITAANGWRVKTREWFANEFPDAEVEEIHAAIGGTGSDLGVFRVQRDALQFEPDLLFVEFAVNDGGASPQRIWQAMEGIVRQAWAQNSRIDICFVYTFRTGFEEPLRKGECPQSISAMEMLADHYGIPSIDFAMKIVELEQAGKLIFKSDQPTKEGVVRFSSDGVHPLDEGHQIYAEIVADAVSQMENTSTPKDHQPKLSTTFVNDHWQAAKMVPIEQSMLSSEWKQLPDDAQLARSFGKRMGTLWETKTPGSTLTF
ncbi:MAG TPA: acyl-CoA thioesterase, partial [Planctomycetaceae bacterium]|nr:acyl-CoA thioesterase [Planctomycetaceae bacterium]